MKNSIKTIAIAFALFATTFAANAGEKETTKVAGFNTGVYTTKAGKVNVLIEKASQDAATVILLKNEKGETVYRETVGKSQQKFGRSLNLDELEAGKYELKVISNGETQTKTFQLSEQKTDRVLTIK